jgi:hypothetical protein
MTRHLGFCRTRAAATRAEIEVARALQQLTGNPRPDAPASCESRLLRESPQTNVSECRYRLQGAIVLHCLRLLGRN